MQSLSLSSISPVPNKQVKSFIENPLEKNDSRVILIRQSLVVQIKISHENIALVGDCMVGRISGKIILVFVDQDKTHVLESVSEIFPVLELFPVPEAIPELVHIPKSSTIKSQLFTIFLYTFLYSSKDFVRKNHSGVCPPIERNPRSHEDFSRRSLDVVLLILRVIFSLSPSRSERMRMFHESDQERIYHDSVSIFLFQSHHDSEKRNIFSV